MAVLSPVARVRTIWPTWRFLAVWQRHLDAAQHTWVSAALMPAVEPLLTFLVLGFGLGQFVELEGGQEYRDFIAPGMLAAFPMWQAVFVCTWEAWMRMESNRTYHAMIATPVEPEEVAAGDVAWAATLGTLSTSYVFLMALAFGAINSPLALLILPLSLVHTAMLGSMALTYTTAIGNSSNLNYFFTIVVLPMFWFGDVFVPIDTLPEGLQALGWFVPTTHTTAIYRGLMNGEVELTMVGDLAWLGAAFAVFVLLAMRFMRRRLIT
ncbi:MAG TPA: ABC transporter permease [Dehalococcoidia bacterium]|nr:ABC transporter permease [Dehalococcoidia bacterium]